MKNDGTNININQIHVYMIYGMVWYGMVWGTSDKDPLWNIYIAISKSTPCAVLVSVLMHYYSLIGSG